MIFDDHELTRSNQFLLLPLAAPNGNINNFSNG